MNWIIFILLSSILCQQAAAQNRQALPYKKIINEQVTVVARAKVVKRTDAGFSLGKIVYDDSLCRLFAGTYGCAPVRDTVPGNVTALIQPVPLLAVVQEPLFVVDGILLPAGTIPRIDAADIATIDILKPASVSSFVSCRPVRKVILITTRMKML